MLSKCAWWRWGILFMLGVCAWMASACEVRDTLPTRAVALATVEIQPTEWVDQAAASPVPPTFTAMPKPSIGVLQVNGAVAAPSSTPIATQPLPTRTATPTATATSTATATRYVSSIPDLPPTDELGPSKLGLHVVRNNDPRIMEFVRQAQPAVMKAVDDFGFLAEVREASPRTITVGRHSITNQDHVGDPVEAARDYVEEHLETYRANPAVDYWEAWNEPDPNGDRMIWYSRFEQERCRLMAENGFRCAIGGFATGVPELDEFVLFLPAIDVANKVGGVLTLHEYSAPDMAYLYGSPLPGYPPYPDRGALTFRYRWIYEEILKPADMVIPLIITEAGVDGIIGNRPGPAGTGWKDFQSYWERQGLGETGEQAFINQLAWYDAGVRQDGYVIGFTIFTAGGIDQWKRYDVNPILPELTDYVVGQR
ncbi:MAG: hypothetical protein JSW55_18570 [Chloroflexota bacterium]|nr:MAG: hypothetical protein JSW55_18570 [Chloroflexota bacterium]